MNLIFYFRTQISSFDLEAFALQLYKKLFADIETFFIELCFSISIWCGNDPTFTHS